MPNEQKLLLKNFERYLNKIVDQTRRNSLLNLKRSKKIVLQYDFQEFLKIIESESTLYFTEKDHKQWKAYMEKTNDEYVEPSLPDLSPTKITGAKTNLISIIDDLRLSYKRDKSEYGVHSLFLTLGNVHWSDSRYEEREFEGPILLVSANLERKRENGYIWTFKIDCDEVVINPALKVILENQHGAPDLSIESCVEEYKPKENEKVEDLGFKYNAVGQKLEKIFKAKADTDFKIENLLTISKHRFQNYHIYEDLKNNQESIVESPFVQGILMAEEGAEGKFIIHAPEDESEILSAEKDFSVLDADSSQQQVISQVSQGQSLIVQGPPGTGKSQTIANLISNLVARDKSVLFVCDKKVALKVVQKRLSEAGLSELLFPLYEGVDDKKVAAKEIVNTYSNLTKKGTIFNNGNSLHNRENILKELYSYKQFLNTNSEGLDFTVKDKIFDLSLDETLPLLELLNIRIQDFDREQFDSITERFSASEKLYNSCKEIYDRFGSRNKLTHCNEESLSEMKTAFNKTAQTFTLLQSLPRTLLSKNSLLQSLGIIKAANQFENELKRFVDLGFSGNVIEIFQSLNNQYQNISGLLKITQTNNWQYLESEEVKKLKACFSPLHEIADTASFDALLGHQRVFKILCPLKGLSSLKKLSLENFQLLTNFGLNYKKYNQVFAHCKTKQDFQKLSIVVQRLSDTNLQIDLINESFLEFGIDLKEITESQQNSIRKILSTNIYFPFGSKFSAVKSTFKSLSFLSPERLPFFKCRKLLTSLKEHNSLTAKKSLLVASIRDTNLLAFNTEQLIQLKASIEIINRCTQQLGHELSELIVLSNEVEPFWSTRDQIVVAVKALEASQTTYSVPTGLDLEDLSTFISFSIEKEAALSNFLKAFHPYVSKLSTIAEIKNWLELQTKFHEQLSFITNELAMLGGDFSGTKAVKLIEGTKTYIKVDEKKIVEFKDITLKVASKILDTGVKDTLKALAILSECSEKYISKSNDVVIDDLCDQITTALNDWALYIVYCEFHEFEHWCDENGLKRISESFILQKNRVWGKLVSDLLIIEWIAKQEFAGISGLDILKKVKSGSIKTLAAEFRTTDLDCINDNHKRILSEHSQKISRLSIPTLLKRESNKKRQLKSVNELVSGAGAFMQEIKPVWLMNPSTISMHFSKSKLKFDCVIFDESSQLKLEHALSAASLADQIVILGDEHQLPPTTFFETIDDDHEDETDDYQYEDLLAAGKTLLGVSHEAMLNYHYRSRYEELIAFSNHFVYQDRLITFPNPEDSHAVSLEYVKNSICLEGRNDLEAQKVVEVCKAIADDPNNKGKSLGVIALSKKQENAIRESFHSFISNNLLYEEVFGEELDGIQEPFFIKNLENVQGDERDIIVLSTAYGKDNKGNVPQRFGPINTSNGYRRLNVAVTRAKEKMVCVTSLRAIDITEGTNRGRQMLKQYLNYCELGKESLNTENLTSEGPEESDFEISVRDALQSRGLVVDTQVGVSGYRIDLGIKDTSRNRYLLGIECDGSVYHKSYSARVNDRIRESHLKNLGWNIFRIWSYDWAEHREDVIEDILALVHKYSAQRIKKQR